MQLATKLKLALLLAVRSRSAPRGGRGTPRSGPIPIVLDTDIGTDIDDAFALALIMKCPELELLGVTTVAGHAGARAPGGQASLDRGRPLARGARLCGGTGPAQAIEQTRGPKFSRARRCI